MIKQFNFPTTIRFGLNSVKELSENLLKNHCSRVLIVTDKNLSVLEMTSTIISTLRNNGIEILVFSDFSMNPTVSDIEQGVKKFKENKCNGIVGLGGGASMDSARAIMLMVNHPGKLLDYENEKFSLKINPLKLPYFVAIPTTSGTGSEVGRSSVISNDNTNEKRVIFSPFLLAKLILSDPKLTESLPPLITATTGIDALVHNVEAYLVDSFHPMCDGIAIEAISLIKNSFLNSVNTPNIANRSEMMMASTMGAVAFQKGLGVTHSIAHALSAFKNIHHGLANALVFVEALEFNKEMCAKKYSYIENILKVPDFIGYIKELLIKSHIKLGLKNYGINKENIPDIAKIAIKDECHLSNPRKVYYNDFIKILELSL